MAAITGRDTKPERQVRKALHARGFRFRVHRKDLPGRPDIVLSKHRAVIFVHGCFWHGHDCPLFKVPATRTEFWIEKIGRNQDRDALQQLALKDSGWRVATVWECALKGPGRKGIEQVAERLAIWLPGSDTECTIRGLQTRA